MQPFAGSRGWLGMIMTHTTLYARAGATAIAAVLALSSTPLAAQDVPAPTEPVVVAPPPPTISPPVPNAAPATESAPTPEAVTSAPEPAAMPAAKPTATKRPAASTRTPPAKAAPSRPAIETAAPQVAARPTPIVDTSPAAKTAAAAPAVAPPATTSSRLDETAIELGAGAIALLALGGAAVAMIRRRRGADEAASADEVYEPVRSAAAPEPVAVEQPAIVAPPLSAFSWGNSPARSTPHARRVPAETWVERAYRGPSPENPSLSLRRRLKRAAFFDKREREAAAGMAPRVEPDAGLPANVDIRELEAA